ncbi:MAG: hypothetical protein PHX85_02260 [Methanobacteriaceae archaeon]|nr:hypothetical protein [Methanobacteriaceae archaeon]
MENKNIIIIAVLIIVLIGMFVFLDLNPAEDQQAKNNQQQKQEEAKQERPEQQEGEAISEHETSPEVSPAVVNRDSMRIIDGPLFDVGDNYIIIEQTIPVNGIDSENVQFEHEYKKIKVDDEAEIIDLNAGRRLTIPNHISGALEILNYLKSKLDDYNVYVHAGYPAGQSNNLDSSGIDYEKDVATYIEWSAWSKN